MSYFQVVAIPMNAETRKTKSAYVDLRLYTEVSEVNDRVEELKHLYTFPCYEVRVIVVSVA